MPISEDEFNKNPKKKRKSSKLHSKKKPNRKTKDSQIGSFLLYNSTGKGEIEKWLVINGLLDMDNVEGSRGMIAKKLNLPINHITRCVYDLAKDGLIEELEERKKCKVTGV